MEFQHAFVVADIDKKKVMKVVRRTCTEREKISFLKDVKIRNRFEGKVIKLVDAGLPNLWRHFKDWILKVCDEVCGKRRRRRSMGDAWWWN